MTLILNDRLRVEQDRRYNAEAVLMPTDNVPYRSNYGYMPWNAVQVLRTRGAPRQY